MQRGNQLAAAEPGSCPGEYGVSCAREPDHGERRRRARRRRNGGDEPSPTQRMTRIGPLAAADRDGRDRAAGADGGDRARGYSRSAPEAEDSALKLTRALATAITTTRVAPGGCRHVAVARFSQPEPFGAISADGLARSARRSPCKALSRLWRVACSAARFTASGTGSRSQYRARGPARARRPGWASSERSPRSRRTVNRRSAPLTAGPLGYHDGIPVRVPVQCATALLRYVARAAIHRQAGSDRRRVVNRQRVPQVWTVSVFDSGGIRVARSRAITRSFSARRLATRFAAADVDPEGP